ncbi:DUF2802 domain-containing protein [Chitinilyticum litopenaei]|uniref:DUF2802 domain-containing protein n=1 Tax=Chitinilyticum litopenaei TaxID=1121276 RepID=UPI000412FC53|nr:DUF2802 domain-containing protein [Chitinilyticum litopenaei]
MQPLVISWVHLLYVLLFILVLYVGQLLFFYRKLQLRQYCLELNKRVVQLEDEVHALEQRLQGLQLGLMASAEVQIREEEISDTPYARAIKLAKAGTEVDVLIRECGLSRGEADLIMALYRAGKY